MSKTKGYLYIEGGFNNPFKRKENDVTSEEPKQDDVSFKNRLTSNFSNFRNKVKSKLKMAGDIIKIKIIDSLSDILEKGLLDIFISSSLNTLADKSNYLELKTLPKIIGDAVKQLKIDIKDIIKDEKSKPSPDTNNSESTTDEVTSAEENTESIAEAPEQKAESIAQAPQEKQNGGATTEELYAKLSQNLDNNLNKIIEIINNDKIRNTYPNYNIKGLNELKISILESINKLKTSDYKDIINDIKTSIKKFIEDNNELFNGEGLELKNGDETIKVLLNDTSSNIEKIENEVKDKLDDSKKKKGFLDILKPETPEEKLKRELKEKEEKEENEKKEKEELEKLIAELKALYTDFMTAPNIIKLPVILAFLIILTISGLSIFYIYLIYSDFRTSLLIKNPLNSEALDYNIGQSISFNPITLFKKSVRYKFVLFLLLPLLALTICIFVVYKIYKSTEEIKGIVKLITFIISIQCIIALLTTIIGFYAVNKNIKDIQRKTSDFNNYVKLNLYTNTEFLNVLKKIPTNSYSMLKAIQAALSKISDDDKNDSEKVAKALLTINIYIHMQKMGFQNPNIKDAFKLFDINNIESANSFSPSDFLYRKPTYIYNYTRKIIEVYQTSNPQSLNDLLVGFMNDDLESESLINSETIQNVQDTLFTFDGEVTENFEAVPSTSNTIITDTVFQNATVSLEEMIRKLNELVFKFNPESAFNSFISIFIVICIVSLLPIFVFISLKNRAFRAKIMSVLTSAIDKVKEKE